MYICIENTGTIHGRVSNKSDSRRHVDKRFRHTSPSYPIRHTFFVDLFSWCPHRGPRIYNMCKPPQRIMGLWEVAGGRAPMIYPTPASP